LTAEFINGYYIQQRLPTIRVGIMGGFESQNEGARKISFGDSGRCWGNNDGDGMWKEKIAASATLG
jgi:hypothetical protein